jgi:hypothetical protein
MTTSTPSVSSSSSSSPLLNINRSIYFRDAEDAVLQRDGYNYDGYTLRVEFPRGGGGGTK